MKLKISLGLVVMSLLLSFTYVEAVTPKSNKKEKTEIKSQGRYRVTAQTRHKYRKNHWVDLIVKGNVASYGNSIYNVSYDDGYGVKRLSHYTDYEYENSYYVFIDSEQYYFTF